MHTHTRKDGHRDSTTESAQWADSVKKFYPLESTSKSTLKLPYYFNNVLIVQFPLPQEVKVLVKLRG